MIQIQENFDQMSWHDCHIWAMEFRVGEPGEGDWTSELALDIDFIVEWTCGTNGVTGFRIAPANLVFHGVILFIDNALFSCNSVTDSEKLCSFA
jgi:hypothetical protein